MSSEVQCTHMISSDSVWGFRAILMSSKINESQNSPWKIEVHKSLVLQDCSLLWRGSSLSWEYTVRRLLSNRGALKIALLLSLKYVYITICSDSNCWYYIDTLHGLLLLFDFWSYLWVMPLVLCTYHANVYEEPGNMSKTFCRQLMKWRLWRWAFHAKVAKPMLDYDQDDRLVNSTTTFLVLTLISGGGAVSPAM